MASYREILDGFPSDLKTIAKNIVDKSRKEASVDTGRLRRSISYVINREGVLTFTEVFYGQFGENSNLQENIKEMLPQGVPYNLIYTDDNGRPYEVVRKSARGRTQVTQATARTTPRSLGIGGIKNFLKRFIDGNDKTKKEE